MNRKSAKGLTKHIDFILLDIICLQISFVIAYWIFHEFSNPYDNDAFQYQAVVLMTSQLVYIMFGGGYSGILRRGKIDELGAVIKHTAYTLIIALIFLFAIHKTDVVSRLQYGGTVLIFILLDWIIHLINKARLQNKRDRERSLILVTSSDLLFGVMKRIGKDKTCFVSGIFLLDTKPDKERYNNIPIYQFGDEHMIKFIREWVDEVLIVPPNGEVNKTLTEFINSLMYMGIRVDLTLPFDMGMDKSYLEMRKIGEQKVITVNFRSASAHDALVKRILDVVVSIIGCVFVGLIAIILGPIVYIKSPGPLFFVQERIGKNGKPFRMFKFRTMYPDAEKRKEALMDRNRISDGLMFKLDDDPRIIGSEKKNKKGEPCGIGNFMRKYSLDEFPQFINVLRGDMSVVGWRPCTVVEWEKYNLSERIRASMKPGITGLWQISGRSSITDFDEVVRLDREYLENWSIGSDIKIMIKTVWVLLTGKGAM